MLDVRLSLFDLKMDLPRENFFFVSDFEFKLNCSVASVFNLAADHKVPTFSTCVTIY
jgi:hypothetical protein